MNPGRKSIAIAYLTNWNNILCPLNQLETATKSLMNCFTANEWMNANHFLLKMQLLKHFQQT